MDVTLTVNVTETVVVTGCLTSAIVSIIWLAVLMTAWKVK